MPAEFIPRRRRATAPGVRDRRNVPGLLELESRRLLAASPAPNPTAVVTDLFESVLFREPTAGDLGYWTPRVQGRGASVQAQLLASPERAQLVKDLGVDIGGSSESFVDSLYTNLMGIHGAPEAEAPWVAMVDRGASREVIVQNFLTSPLYPGVPTMMTLLGTFPTSSAAGDAVLLSVGVVPGAGSLAPTGTVEFFANGIDLGPADVSGFHASILTTALPAGTDQITAVYSGDHHYRGSTSAATTFVVAPTSTIRTTTSLIRSVSSAPSGSPVTFTVLVNARDVIATGTVDFYRLLSDGSAGGGLALRVLIGTVPLDNGAATFTTSSLPVGTQSIMAVFEGNATFATSSAPAVDVQILQATTTALAASTSTTTVGQPVTLTATVAPTAGTAQPGGTVSFGANVPGSGEPIILGDAPLVDGKATLTTTALPAGDLAVFAVYQGGETFAVSTSPNVPVAVRPAAPAATTTTIAASPASSTYGDPVTLTADVTSAGGTPTGAVEFYERPPLVMPAALQQGSAPLSSNASILLGTATLSGGQAHLVTTALAANNDGVYASYLGNGDFAASVSAATTPAVARVATTTALAASATSVPVGQPVTFTATITRASGSGMVTGPVSFSAGGDLLGSALVDPATGKAVFTTGGLQLDLGTNAVTATYLGDANALGSTSPGVSVFVGLQSITTFGIDPSDSTVGELVNIYGNVNGSNGIPTGTVEVLAGTTLLTTLPVTADPHIPNQGDFSTTTTALPLGTTSITIAYSGDSNYAVSSSTEPVTVSPASTN